MKLGADYVATGHYCQKGVEEIDGKNVYKLLAGADKNKDQSYFLCQLNQNQLSKALFPIGHLQKPEVREIAQEAGLVTADKKDSQGLCFIGKVKLPDFLQQQLKPKAGKVVEIPKDAGIYAKNGSDRDLEKMATPFAHTAEMGNVVGEHNGAHFFTIGQRKGLGIGGTPEPLFVIETDTENNIIYTGQGENHPGLYRSALFIPNSDTHWVREDLKMNAGQSQKFDIRIRYRQPLQAGTVHKTEEGIYIEFDEPQRGITPGQFAAWYNGDELIGSGVIA
jgi:tRNA-specific 2-thiouridylase